MRESIRILFLAAEADPFVKVGGLADVAGSLPVALQNLPIKAGRNSKLDVRLILPLHGSTKINRNDLLKIKNISILFGDVNIEVQFYKYLHWKIPVYFIESDLILNASTIYSNNPTNTDQQKYALFSIAILKILELQEWQPDILHANDWHTSLTLYCLRFLEYYRSKRIKTILTLHNLPYMGGDGKDILEKYHVVPPVITKLPSWAKTQFLPLGLDSADFIVPVSPSYAQEILTTEFGCGLETYLQSRKNSIYGILNGLDQTTFDPKKDPYLVDNFDASTIQRRKNNRRELQKNLGLPCESNIVMFGMVGRINWQKGIDIAIKAFDLIDIKNWQFVLLGSGEPNLESEALDLQERHPDNVRSVFRYDERLGRLIYGGADFFLMPSRYEPCGLAQMIAMRYGCVPIVRATGGLRDTIQDGKTGFLFNGISSEALLLTIERALAVFNHQQSWHKLIRTCMNQDFGWSVSAIKYRELYQQLLIKDFQIESTN